MKIILSIALTLTYAASAMAEDVYSDQFQTIQSVEFAEIITDENGNEKEVILEDREAPKFEDQFEVYAGSSNKSDIGTIIMVTEKLIALGEKIYKIVERGRPVVDLQSEPIEILPRDDKGQAISAMQLHGWKAPISRKYKVTTKNYLGMKPASFEFMLIYSYGGQNRGSGRYITGAQIKPTSVDVKWGYKLDAKFYVQSIMNQGTEENPVAGATLMIDYKISTVLQDSTNNKTFFINGLGQVQTY